MEESNSKQSTDTVKEITSIIKAAKYLITKIDKDLINHLQEVDFLTLSSSDNSEKYYFIRLLSILIRKMVKAEFLKIEKNSNFVNFQDLEKGVKNSADCDNSLEFKHLTHLMDNIDSQMKKIQKITNNFENKFIGSPPFMGVYGNFDNPDNNNSDANKLKPSLSTALLNRQTQILKMKE